MTNFNLETCKYDFSTDNINIITLVYDKSGSMEGDYSKICKANAAFYQDFSRFEDKNSIAIAKAMFDDYFEMSSFEDILKFDTSYGTGGGTALYRAIRYAADNTISYYNEIVKRLNIRPRITFMVFTDGYDTSRLSSDDARAAIMELNSLDATTVFVAFREAIRGKDGERLGFNCTKDIETASELITCLGKQLSKSCKEQSMSVYSLKSEFFSQAEKDTTEDNVEDSPITDDDFFNI